MRLLGITAQADGTRTPAPNIYRAPVMRNAPPKGALPAPQERTGLAGIVETAGNLIIGDDLRKLITRGKVSKGAAFDAAMLLPMTKAVKLAAKMAKGGKAADAALRAANPEIRELAKRFMQSDVGEVVPTTMRAVDQTGPKIAEWYAALKSNPNDPAVIRAYKSLAAESHAQMQAIRDAGIDVQFVKNDPYKDSAEMMNDIRKNKRLKVFASDDKAHPLLSGVDNSTFRGVHDYFGHAMEGHQFGPLGEERAFREHMRMFSPEARRAMAVETRGQNSFINFGPDAQWNRANPAQTRYPQQKVGLMPDELMQTIQDPGPATVTFGGVTMPVNPRAVAEREARNRARGGLGPEFDALFSTGRAGDQLDAILSRLGRQR